MMKYHVNIDTAGGLAEISCRRAWRDEDSPAEELCSPYLTGSNIPENPKFQISRIQAQQSPDRRPGPSNLRSIHLCNGKSPGRTSLTRESWYCSGGWCRLDVNACHRGTQNRYINTVSW